ncbi:NAD-dependent epimerase/dehydratase family protein [Bacillus sp. DX4.1]|uniref:NAD-dependent epimerase/dehydratase family protein n=1 Tax=Bacillus sp. DX4.1 TaxID=3055867 RepID=UPI0025A23A49|nr:NAD-dependent epimerase/dehydratase family protein [Bacillus sp. DX4.1]MDM5188954.1 NAD-dependent epimerase/dehydratase family protein [Bacillus sp. DX4.1]
MKLLILGGSRFLGRAIVEEGLKSGHELTVFNRGNQNDIFQNTNVEVLIGDRDGDLEVLKGRKWDAAIDTCGFVPRTVGKATSVLAHHISHYTYVSSISVYRDWIPKGITEEYDTPTLSKEKVNDITRDTAGPIYNEYYGPLKRMCEIEAEKNMPNQVFAVRAGLIVGANDYADRLPYWVKRISEGGTVLAPGNPKSHVQLIDVKDLAMWILYMIERNVTGIYNATGPDAPLTMEQLLQCCKQVTNSDAEFTWASEQFLLENHVAPWTEMPLWLPEEIPLQGEKEPWRGSGAISIDKALQTGLSFRSIEETITDIWKWEQLRSKTEERKAGLASDKEQQLLEKWMETQTSLF